MRYYKQIWLLLFLVAAIIFSCKKHSSVYVNNGPTKYTKLMAGMHSWSGGLYYSMAGVDSFLDSVKCSFSIDFINDTTIRENLYNWNLKFYYSDDSMIAFQYDRDKFFINSEYIVYDYINHTLTFNKDTGSSSMLHYSTRLYSK